MAKVTFEVDVIKKHMRVKKEEIDNMTEAEIDALIGFLVAYRMFYTNEFETKEEFKEKAMKIFSEVIES